MQASRGESQLRHVPAGEASRRRKFTIVSDDDSNDDEESAHSGEIVRRRSGSGDNEAVMSPTAAQPAGWVDMDDTAMMEPLDTTQPLDARHQQLPLSGPDPYHDSPQMPHAVDLRITQHQLGSPEHDIDATMPLLHLPCDDHSLHGTQQDLDPRLSNSELSHQQIAPFAPDSIMVVDPGPVLHPVPSSAMITGQDCNDDFWLGSNILDYMDLFSADVPPTPPHSGAQQSNTIPRERYSQVQRLWPTRKSFAKTFSPNIWDDVVRHKSDNILSDPGIRDTPSYPLAEDNERQTSPWALDDDRRQRLIQYADAHGLSSRPGSSNDDRHRIDSLQSRRDGARLPPTRLLNLALAMAFRRFQTLVPFIHQPTFSVKTAPDSIVFALCLLGLVVLDSEQTKAFALRHLGEALRRCYKDLTQCFGERKASWKTIVTLGSAILLLTTFSICGESARRDESQAEMLYNHTISLAQLSGLFTPDVDRASAKDTYLNTQARFHTKRIDEECLWKAWARIESLKRIITSLFMMDAWWAYSIRISPLIHSKALYLELPCSTELFHCRTVMAWRRTLRSGHDVHTCPVTLQLDSPEVGVTAWMVLQNMCPTAMTGVLCMIWIYVLELQDWQVNYRFHPHMNLLASNNATKSVTKILADLQHKHDVFLRTQDANCITLWHLLNMSFSAHMTTFELAAGQKGAESARVALDEIAVWGQTSYARRACLHAAGIYKSMSRRRTGEGTMFHSETALFSAALVIGLYVFTVPDNPEPALRPSMTNPQVEPFELLDDVDWSALEHGRESDPDALSGVGVQQLTQAALFVEQGGSATFSGINCGGGYDAAKTILLEFASLLEEVGKWNAKRLCQILMTLSDSLLDVED